MHTASQAANCDAQGLESGGDALGAAVAELARLCFVLYNVGPIIMYVPIHSLACPLWTATPQRFWLHDCLPLWRLAMLAHQIITNPSGFASCGTIVVSHEVKTCIRTFC